MSNEHLILGDLSADYFLANYWQKKPLVIRNAIPDFVSPVDGNDLAAMSLEPEVESRLIIGDDYQLEHGPFDETRFQELPEDNWTGYTGFIHQIVLDNALKDHTAPEDIEYYICGPPMMNSAVFKMLDDLGVEPDNIRFDDFG